MLNRRAISSDNGLFHLRTEDTSYILRVTPYGHLEQVWWGAAVRDEDAEALAVKRTCCYGESVMYRAGDETYCLDTLPLEWSGSGRGDYRCPPVELTSAAGATTDFRYVSGEITEGCAPMECGLPQSCGGAETLTVLLRDETAGAELRLFYTVYPKENVIARRARLVNIGGADIEITKLMSMSVDLAQRELVMMTFGGGWISEGRRCDRDVEPGMLVSESRTGSSSNRTNPGFILRGKTTTEEQGRCWGFNLVYSGSHYECAERSAQGLVRVMCGISPDRFRWKLSPGESFETPEAVLSYSGAGLNGLSRNMHSFVNRRIVRGKWADRERPVLVNVWEAFMFSFTRDRLLGVAKKAKAIGAELFVLDDGWFMGRDSDTAGLGDYAVNEKKLPGGLEELSRRVNDMGMDFGLWFEPEAVSPNSDLYRAHPDWAISDPGREDVYGRNELLLDLTRAEVRDYIVESVSAVLGSANIAYVKWDMNRHLAGRDGAFAHRYILGLYQVLDRIFAPRPDILLESCSSGGNRFDLGMLCFSPQIWTSDDTDPMERLNIQKGLSYLYPLSAMGAHVSASPNAQTLRDTPLATRFNASCFGDLGYELDLRELTAAEEREVKAQVEFYKKHRRTFQFGELRRPDGLPDWQEGFTVIAPDGREAICGHFRRMVPAAPPFDTLPVCGLDEKYTYSVKTKPQCHAISAFGRLISYVLPVRLSPRGGVMRAADALFAVPDCEEEYTATGAALNAGIRIANLYAGTGYNPNIRLPGDFGSNLYVLTRLRRY